MVVRVARRLFTVEDYHRMREAGILSEDDRVELIEGEILEMSPIGSRHAGTVARLVRIFSQRLGERAVVWPQNPIRLGVYSEPQPDVALLRPREDFYEAEHPGPGDVWLVVEVADRSVEGDRGVKAPLYGRAGIPEFWLVDLAAGVVEVYREPGVEGYRSVRRLGPGETLAPLAFPDCVLPVEEILGKPRC
ncbi:MAG: Uma2 family endonuclease [Thermoflexus sp.]|uniref:Uma2 family endonuclease n=1 Tax=Thermoflexus sp. TaxID=1969742 RepID=UPI00331E2384